MNQAAGTGPLTILLAEGIYAIGETVIFKPAHRTFSRAERLTIRAEVLPDDPEWHIGRMPTLIHTMSLPVPPTWNGRPDPLGGAVNGTVIETSHVTIQGLKVLGLPVVETPQPGLKRRMYAIGRFDPELEDLEVAQCLFAGNEIVAPLHVGVIARGNNLVVHHCIFDGFMKDPVVFWSGGSTGHALRNCIVHGAYGSAVYTAGIANDFEYRNNIVDSCEQVWVYQDPGSAQQDARGQAVQRPDAAQAGPAEGMRYKAIDSLFANNRKLAASGVGAKMEFQENFPAVWESISPFLMKRARAEDAMTDPQTWLVKSMNHTSLTVNDDDFERLLSFFSDGLGLPILEKGPRDPANMSTVVGVAGAAVIIAYVQAPGHTIELINYLQPDDRRCLKIRPCDTGFAHIAFNVADIDAALAVAGEYGFSPIHAPLPVSAGPNVGNLCAYTRDKMGITIEYIGPRLQTST